MRCRYCESEIVPAARLRGDIIRVDYARCPNNPRHALPSLAWAHYGLDGQEIASGCGITNAERETFAEVAAAFAAAWAAQLARRPELASLLALAQEGRLYLRYGLPPRNGRSRNYANGQLERGISAYRARLNATAGIVELEDDDVLPGTLYTYMHRSDCYLLTGNEVGYGSDGEPLLRSVRVLARLRPTRDGYAIIND